MSGDWSNSLKQALTQLARKPPRIAVVGVGQELSGDDAAGALVARYLKPLLVSRPYILILDGGPAPENLTGALRRFAPDLVLLVDAANLGEPPGTVRWLPFEQIDGVSASTHTLPLNMLAQYLRDELGCAVALLGVQPAQMGFGAALSAPVRQSVDDIVQALTAGLP
jgi:hydrogenase 3 maturation protease